MSELRTRLIFGLIGGLSCTVAAAAIEGLGIGRWVDAAVRQRSAAVLIVHTAPVHQIAPATASPSAVVSETRPTPSQHHDAIERLTQAGARGGDVQVALIWQDTNDLDLHMIDPAGDHIYFNRPTSASGGRLDVDANAQEPYTARPVENIYWPTGGAPRGSYQVFVNQYAVHGGPDESPYQVMVREGGHERWFSGVVSTTDPTQPVETFTLPDPAALQPPAHTTAAPAPVSEATSTHRVSAGEPQRPVPTPHGWARWWIGLAVTGSWGAILGGILAFALDTAYGLLSRRQHPRQRPFARTLAGAVSGLAAGITGQLLFALDPTNDLLHILGMAAFGAVMGLCHSVGRVAALSPRSAAAAGALGTAIGGIAFAAASSDPLGRLIVASLVGAAIGLTLTLAGELEAGYRAFRRIRVMRPVVGPTGCRMPGGVAPSTVRFVRSGGHPARIGRTRSMRGS